MRSVLHRTAADGPVSLTYTDAGVNTRLQERALLPFLNRLRGTWANRNNVLLGFGHFANVVNVGGLGLAISTDGVGTKGLIAQLIGKYDTIGIDCVAMNANDVLCVGAEPQSMVDYIAIERISESILDEIAIGLEAGCNEANISLIGGELAQVPDVLAGEGEGDAFDLAGTCIGIVDPAQIISGDRVQPGDAIIGLRSSGIHSNGLTLARRAFQITNEVSRIERKRALDQHFDDLGASLGEELLKPSRIYVREVLRMMQDGVDVRGLAHITTDGLLNLPRLEADVGYTIDSIPEPQPVFHIIQQTGSVQDAEMYEVFNMGIGLCVVVPGSDETVAIASAHAYGTEAFAIGTVTDGPQGEVSLPQLELIGRRGEGFRPA